MVAVLVKNASKTMAGDGNYKGISKIQMQEKRNKKDKHSLRVALLDAGSKRANGWQFAYLCVSSAAVFSCLLLAIPNTGKTDVTSTEVDNTLPVDRELAKR